MNIQYKDLLIFITICEEKSFTKASEVLFIAQPSLSKTIKKLEIDFNVTLLDRSSKILKLTDAGSIFYKKSKEAIRLLNYMEAEIRDLSNDITGEVSIGIPQIIGTIFFSDIAKEYIERFPRVKLNIKEEGGLIIEKLIDEGSLDIGLCVLPTSNKNLESQLIFEDKFVICVPADHKFSNCKEIALDKLKHEDFILFAKSFKLHQMVTKACKEAGFLPKIMFESTQWDLVMELVSSKVGITIVPRVLYSKLNDIDIVPINIKDTSITWKIGLVTKRNSYESNALKKFIEIVHSQYDVRKYLN